MCPVKDEFLFQIGGQQVSALINAVDWIEVILYLPLWINLFGVGLCVRGMFSDWYEQDKQTKNIW